MPVPSEVSSAVQAIDPVLVSNRQNRPTACASSTNPDLITETGTEAETECDLVLNEQCTRSNPQSSMNAEYLSEVRSVTTIFASV